MTEFESFLTSYSPAAIWFAAGLTLLFLEIFIPGLVIFFFGIGAFFVSIVCLLIDISLYTQLSIFIISSLLSLALLRTYFKTAFRGNIFERYDSSINLNDFTNKKAVATSQINPQTAGRVEFRGTSWNAESDETIEVGNTVEIVKKDNLTLKVRKWEK